jgi:hypothetical protein
MRPEEAAGLDNVFTGLGNTFRDWVESHNQVLLRLLLMEQRVGKTQREVEIRILLGL